MEEEELCVCLAMFEKEKGGKRKLWIHPFTNNRLDEGSYHRLVKELEWDCDEFHGYFRMSKDMFDYVLAKIKDVIKRQDTRLCKSISPRERLAVTLRYLATAESFTSLSYNYRIGATTIGLIVKDICAAIWQTMQPEFMKVPSTSDDWREIANGFEESWQFPNCCGAVDGKHVVMKAPPNSGSVFYNYKGTFSIIILAAVDA
ncbi:uncharacterized protein [Haliotis cracherodii]|uniref:uncharacterized protein n=1 Tax=Haliotis cracherodii TaxID=6455 RepID=UPI0039EC8792